MTIAEYELRVKAERLKQVDLDYRCHQIAYLVKAASAEKQSGKGKSKPVYGTFKKFFDYDRAIKAAQNDKDDTSDRLSRFEAYRKGEK